MDSFLPFMDLPGDEIMWEEARGHDYQRVIQAYNFDALAFHQALYPSLATLPGSIKPLSLMNWGGFHIGPPLEAGFGWAWIEGGDGDAAAL